MRTTITLEPDVEALLKKRMTERGLSFKQAVNDALRDALTDASRRKPYRMKTYSMGVPKVDLTHALRLAGELEDEEIVRKLQAGK
jgi:hypothetical protein